MKYVYQKKHPDELEAIANRLLARFPSAVNGRPDIEDLVELMGLTVVPRPGLGKLTTIAGYLPRNGKIVLVDAEMAETDIPLYRVTLAEELAHRELEPELWCQGVPPGANIYELDKHIYDEIESDAYGLAVAILLPMPRLKDRFNQIRQELVLDSEPKEVDWLTVVTLASEFIVPRETCAYRCKKLDLCKVDFTRKPLPGAIVF